MLDRFRWVKIIALGFLLLAGLGLAARPAFQWLRLHRAHRIVAEGKALSASNEQGAALAKFRDAYGLAPNDEEVLRANAVLCRQLSLPQARFFYEKLILLHLGHVEDQLELADILLDNGEYDALAAKLFSEKPVWEKLAAAWRRLEGDENPAEAGPVDGKFLSPALAARLLAMSGRYFTMQGDEEHARRNLRQSLALNPGDYATVILLGRLELRPRLIGSLRLDPVAMDHPDTVTRLLDGLESPGGVAADLSLQALDVLSQLSGLTGPLKERAIKAIRRRPDANLRHHIQVMSWELEDDFGVPSEHLLKKKLAEQATIPFMERAALFALMEQQRQFDLILETLDERVALSHSTLYMARLGALLMLERFDEAKLWLGNVHRPSDMETLELASALFAKLRKEPAFVVTRHLHQALELCRTKNSSQYIMEVVRMSQALENPEVAYEALELGAKFDESRLEALRMQEDMARSASVSATSLAETYRKLSLEQPDNITVQFQAAYYNLLAGSDMEPWETKTGDWQESMPDNSFAWVAGMMAARRFHQSNAGLLQQWNDHSAKWRGTMSEGQLAISAGLLAAAGRRETALDLLPVINRQRLLAEEKAILKLAVEW